MYPNLDTHAAYPNLGTHNLKCLWTDGDWASDLLEQNFGFFFVVVFLSSFLANDNSFVVTILGTNLDEVSLIPVSEQFNAACKPSEAYLALNLPWLALGSFLEKKTCK